MCGIGFLLEACPADQSELGTYVSALRRRGPDAEKQLEIELQGGRTLHLIAAVLHLRGKQLCAQPAEDAHGNILLWNGEVFGGLDVGPFESDTAKVLEMLSRTGSHEEVVDALGRISGPFSLVYWCPARRALYYGRDPAGRRSLVARKPRSPQDGCMAILSCLPEPTGPGGTGSAKPSSPPPALGHHPRTTSEDEDVRPLKEREQPPEVVRVPSTCSTARPHWEEVRADGIYVLDVDDGCSGAAEAKGSSGSSSGSGRRDGWAVAPCAELFPWPQALGAGVAAEPPRAPVAGDTPRSPERQRQQPVCAVDNATTDISSRREGGNGGRVGEGDGRGKQATGARVDPENNNGNGQGDGDTRKGELAKPAEATRVVGVEEEGEEETVKPNGGLIRPAAAGLLARLRDSIHRRVRTVPYSTTTPSPPLDDVMHCSLFGSGTAGGPAEIDSRDGHEEAAQPETEGGGGTIAASVGRERGDDKSLKDAAAAATAETSEGSRGVGAPEGAVSRAAPVASRVGVLFSGGLDSVVLAAMLAEEGEGRKPAVPKGEAIDLINVCFDSPSGHQSPDRLASIAAVDELKALFPLHVWRLVCVDASYDDVLKQTGAIWRVMQPCTTTMDFNIAAAFWFASRGTGWLYQPHPHPRPRPRPPLPPAPVSPTHSQVGANAAGLRAPHGSTAPEPPGGSRIAGGVSTTAPFPRPTSPPAAAAVSVEAPADTGDPAAGVQREEGGSTQGFSDIAAGETAPADAAAGNGQEGSGARNSSSSSSSSSSEGQKKAAKVNKNSAELCPVDGCRRLLKPGCVFDVCSRCCLKAQGLVDAAAAAAAAASSSSSSGAAAAATPPETRAIGEEAAAAANKEPAAVAEAVEAAADPTPGTAAQQEGAAAAAAAASERQRVCKARAETEATRALEARLLDRFGADLPASPPFPAEALAALLLLLRGRGQTAGLASLGREAGAKAGVGGDRQRDRSFRPALALGSCGARPQPIKWCRVHKRPRRKEAGADRGGASPGEREMGAGEKRAGRWLGGSTAAVVTSGARVLLVGIGADEFMGGYSRHRNAFNRGGDDALAAELVKDQGRLWTRNLGRDDRSIADHGREARFPFLDEGVIGYIRSLPLRDVCDMDEPAGFGDKKILREVAAHLGLESCRALPKRAIQFGSRIAQHCARHTHGSHRRGSGSDPASAVGVSVSVSVGIGVGVP